MSNIIVYFNIDYDYQIPILANTIRHANFDVENGYVVYCKDDNIQKRLYDTYRIHSEIRQYNQIKQYLNFSKDNQLKTIVYLDPFCTFNYHALNGIISRRKITKNKICCFRVNDFIYDDTNCKDYFGNILLVNSATKDLVEYCCDILLEKDTIRPIDVKFNPIKYYNYHVRQYYTVEDFLNSKKGRKVIKYLKTDNKVLYHHIKIAIHFCGYYTKLDKMIETKTPYEDIYQFDEDCFKDLKNYNLPSYAYRAVAESAGTVRYCYTVKSKKYAILLLNGLRLSNANQNFMRIYCWDDESKEILKNSEFASVIRDSHGINVYIDKVINAMKYSMECPNEVIVGVDSGTVMPYGDDNPKSDISFVRKFIANNNKQVYVFTPEFWSVYNYANYTVPQFKKFKNIICGGIVMYYNVTKQTLNDFIKSYDYLCNTKNIDWYTLEDTENSRRYYSLAPITEEQALEYMLNSKYRKVYDYDFESLRGKKVNNKIKDCQRFLNNSFMLNFGVISCDGNTLNRFIESKEPYIKGYYFDNKLLRSL